MFPIKRICSSLALITIVQGGSKKNSNDVAESVVSDGVDAVEESSIKLLDTERIEQDGGTASSLSHIAAQSDEEASIGGGREAALESNEGGKAQERAENFDRELAKRLPLVPEEKKRAFKEYLAKLERIPLNLQRLEQSVREKYGLLGIANPEDVLEELTRLHEGGDKTVAYDLGLYLSYGHASIVDHEAAQHLLMQAVSEGDVRGLSALGNLYLNGIGVEKDSAEAQLYYELALAEGDYEAGYLLGRGMREGRFGTVDLEESKRYLVAAAEAGSQAAARSLYSDAIKGMEKGRRSPTEYIERFREYPEMESWLLRGAEDGQIDDIITLSKLYGATGRLDEAAVILKQGVELGSYEASQRLLIMNVPRLMREGDTRAGFEEMFESFAQEGSRREDDALFYLALIEITKGAKGADLARAVELLEKSADLKQPKSKLALLRIKDGDHPAKSILAAAKMDDKEAYAAASVLAADLGEGKESVGGEILDRPPTVLKLPQVEYPYEIMKEAIEGSVVVELIVDGHGIVQAPKVVRSTHAIFEAEALKRAHEIQFMPAVKEGKTVASKVRIPFNFKPSEDTLVPSGDGE